MPLVRDRSGSQPWNSARIVSALVKEAELPRELAEEVAERYHLTIPLHPVGHITIDADGNVVVA